jgi:transcriptional regulator with XRE-family HTH domain
MPDSAQDTVGTRIRRLRRARGWTQGKLAEGAGLSVEGLSRIERGSRTPRIDTVGRIARALQVEVTDLAGRLSLPTRASVEEPVLPEVQAIADLLVDAPLRCIGRTSAASRVFPSPRCLVVGRAPP